MHSTDTNDLELIGISKRFGGNRAVEDINIAFDRGRVTCIIGPNGAGKTTLFNLMCGMLRPDTGTVRFVNRDIQGLPPHRVSRMGMGRLFQDVRIFPRMSVLDNVCVAAKTQPGENALLAPLWPAAGGRAEQANRRDAQEHLAFVGLGGCAGSLAEELSYGQQKLLAIARLLNNQASCFLLDEPTSGVNPATVQDIVAIVRKLAANGNFVVVIEHDLEVVRVMGDWVYFMDKGRVDAFGSASDVLRAESLRRLMPGS